MDLSVTGMRRPSVGPFALPFYYGCVNLTVAALAIVIFFTFWSQAFGRTHLGKIQGAAQALTVVAPALGPLLLAECVTRTGSYAAMFYLLTLIVVLLAFCAWFVRLPLK